MGRRSAHVMVKPWGVEEVWASSHHSVGKILSIKRGHRLSRKYHRIKRHRIRILTGRLVLEVGPTQSGGTVETVVLESGEGYFLDAHIIHRFCAEHGPVSLLELSDSGPDDSVRLEDDYRRITKIPTKAPQSDK